MNYGSNYPAPPGNAANNTYAPPDSLEKKRLRRCFSNAAWLVLILQFGTFIPVIILQSAFMFAGIDAFSENADGEIICSVPFVICSYFTVPLTVLIIALCYYSRAGNSFSALFNTDRLSPKKVALTVFVTLGYANFVYFVQMYIYNIIEASGLEYDMMSVTEPTSTAAAVLDVIASSIAAPVFEEIFYRGIIMKQFCKVSKRFAVFASAFIFGLAHENIYQFILALTIGIIWGYADIKFRSIIPSMVSHIALNSHLYIYKLFEPLGEELSSTIEYYLMIGFIMIAGIIVSVLLSKKAVKFPPYTEYHKARTLPVIVSSLPCWIVVIYYTYEIFSKFHIA